MTTVLAAPWQPRGELNRLRRYLPRLREIYDGIVVGLADAADDTVNDFFDSASIPRMSYGGWSGRHTVLTLALEHDADAIHYVDMDRLVRWVETRPEELAMVAAEVADVDCLVIGRTSEAYATHTRTLIETERLTNAAFSHWFGREMDFSAGSRGFSKEAAEFILKHDTSGNALAMDAGWAVLLRRGGFTIRYTEVEGLDWETADRHRDVAATRDQQRELAVQQDADANLWAFRVRVANEILQHGLAAIDQPLD